MKSVLVSFFNSNNIGDQLIGDFLIKMLNPYFTEIKCVSFSGNLELENKFESSDVKNSSLVKQRINDVKNSINSNINLGPLAHFFRKGNNQSFDYFEKSIDKADVLVIGGGNMIFDLNYNSLSAERFNRFIEITKRKSKKIFVVSIGIGPFKTDYQEKKAIESLSKCDYITFRDKSSYDIFRKYNKNHSNVSVSIDPVYLMSNRVDSKSKKNCIGVNIINSLLFTKDKNVYNNSVTGYISIVNKLLESTNSDIILFSSEIADYKTVEKVFGYFDNDRVKMKKITKTNDLLMIYDSIDFLVGTRMHAMIIAYTQRVPMIGLSWQEKVNSMFRIIEQDDSIFDFYSFHENLEKINDKIHEKLNLFNNENDIEKVYNKVILRNEKNIEILELISSN